MRSKTLIKTQHLIIREFEESDQDRLAPLLANPQVMRFSLSSPLTPDQTRAFIKGQIENYKKRGFGLWALIYENELIGSFGLLAQTLDGVDKVELSYRLDPQYWGKGLALEAARGICEYAFSALELEQLISIIDTQNIPSIKLAKRLGMVLWKKDTFHGIEVEIYALNKLSVVSFQKEWSQRFKNEEGTLKAAFQGLDISFYHIGSTSIEQCFAKPIIDILGTVNEIAKVDSYNKLMQDLGFEAMGEYGIKQRRYFRRRDAFPVNLHIFEKTDPEVERHLRFCHYLKIHPEKVREYSELKMKLSKEFPHDIERYIRGKEHWIKNIDYKAAIESPALFFPVLSEPRKQGWDLKDIRDANHVNMYTYMTYFAKIMPTIEFQLDVDVTLVKSEIADDTFNYVLSARFSESNVERRVADVLNFYGKQPFSWWVESSDTPISLAQNLEDQGLIYKEEDLGMYLDLSNFKQKQTISTLSIKRVLSQLALKDFAHVMIEIGINPNIFDLFYSKIPPLLYQENAICEWYVAYLNDSPIGVGILLHHANVAGIYNVVIVSQERRKGHGSTILNYLLNRAQSLGFTIATLQASKDGKSLYERLGFKQYAVIKEYAGNVVV